MDFDTFGLSILASIIATLVAGSSISYKLINKRKKKKTIRQKGNNNTAIMDSEININSDKKSGGEK